MYILKHFCFLSRSFNLLNVNLHNIMIVCDIILIRRIKYWFLC